MSNKTKIQGHNTALESLKNILAVPMEKHGMYVWRKFTAQGGTFLDFVVSDIESAYPDGGLKDGYWYERAENGPYKTTSGSVTLIDTATEITIEHGLGEIPKAYLIAKIDYSVGATVTVAYPICYSTNTPAFSITSSGAVKAEVPTLSDKKITATSNNNTYKFNAGTYMWMAMA